MHIVHELLDQHVLHSAMDSASSVNRGGGRRAPPVTTTTINSNNNNTTVTTRSFVNLHSNSSTTVNNISNNMTLPAIATPAPNHNGSLKTALPTIPMNSAPFESLYRMGKLIGRGGFGSVFAGWRLRDQSPVAIKQLKKSKIRNWDSAPLGSTGVRVPLEINLLNRVNGVPGVIKMFDWFERSDHYLIVMERPASCTDLFDFITEKGTLPWL
jgi:hypothetical protein